MSTVTQTEARIRSVSVTDKAIVAHLSDGRTVSVPLEWSWRLSDAAPEQRARWEIVGDGEGVHWSDVDEDISVDGLLRGTPVKRPAQGEMRRSPRMPRSSARVRRAPRADEQTERKPKQKMTSRSLRTVKP